MSYDVKTEAKFLTLAADLSGALLISTKAYKKNFSITQSARSLASS